MENGFKRFLSLAMAILMVFSNIPTAAFASGVEGECLHNAVQINTTATCTEAGETITTCLTCGQVLSTEAAEATGHSYVDGACACGELDPDAPPAESEEQIPSEEPSEEETEEESAEETEEEPEETPALCTLTEGCILGEGHEGECFVEAPCQKDETCILMDGHEGECVPDMAVYEGEADDGINTYAELAAALAVSGEVVLGGDIEFGTDDITITVPADVTVILDLNGHDITVPTYNVTAILNYGTLTIKDSVGDGSVTSDCEVIRNGGYLTIDGGTFNSVRGKDAVYSETSGDTIINDGTFNGKVFRRYNKIITINGGTFNAKVTDAYVNGGTFNGDYETLRSITGGKFSYMQPWPAIIAEGYECSAEKIDGYWVVTKIETEDTTINTEEELQALLNAGGPVTLNSNVTVVNGLTIPEGVEVTLDLAGHTISQTKAQTAGYQMILNDGDLTIEDSGGGGKISYTDSGNGGEYISDTIYNRGTLEINGGTIENLSSATVASNGYPHAVDTYSGIRNTSVTINGGTIYCANYSAIRMFCVSATNKADLVIEDGTIKGAVDMQNGTKDAAKGSLTIKGGTFEHTANANNIRFANWNGGATGYGITASIEGGEFDGGITTAYVPAAANWNSKIITGGTFDTDVSAYVAEGYVQNKEDGAVVEKTEVVIPEEIENPEDITDEEIESVAEEITAIKEAIEKPVTENVPQGINMVIALAKAVVGKVENAVAATKLTYEVSPKNSEGEKVSEFAEEITFELPIPSSVTKTHAKVYHGNDLMGIQQILSKNGYKYIKVASKFFSEFTVEPVTPVAEVNGQGYADIQEAIKAAAPSGTVELLSDVTVDKWVMFSETLDISSGQIITLTIDGLTIDGNGHSLTVKSIESAGNGNNLFYDATKLNIQDLTINCVEAAANQGGIGLTSGTISNVTFNGGVGVYPGTGDITITGCTFNTNGSAIYNETDRDNLVVTGNTFNTAAGQYAIYLRGNTTFENNTVVTGKVNVTNSATGTISGNDFGTERFKVYNGATATISNNTINNLVFNDETETKATFTGNTLSEAAETALKAVTPILVAKIGDKSYKSLADALNEIQDGQTVILLDDASISGQNALDKLTGKTLDLNDKTLTVSGNSYFSDGTTTFKNGNIVVSHYATDSFFCGYTAGAVIIFDDVIVTGNTYRTGCAVFNANLGKVVVKDSEVTLSGDDTGGVFYGGTVVVDNTKITATNVCRGFTNSVATIKNASEVALSGKEGASKLETGLNNSTVTIDGSTVTIANATKRAVRLHNNTLELKNAANLTATGCAEDIVAYNESSEAAVVKSEDSTLAAVNALQPDVAQTKKADGTVATYKNFEDAIAAAAADSTITEIVVLCDSALESVKNTTEYYDITGNLVITAAQQVTVSGCGFAVRVMGNGASLTIAENVTIEGLDVVANGFATTGENMTIDGTMKAVSLKQWTNNGTITVTENGKVVLGYGDGQFDMAYGNGTVTITGNGDKTAAQFKAGYSGTRGNGNTLNLKDTYFEGGAWFNVNGSNGTFNVDNSILKVSGGDGAGSLTITQSGNVINLTNGAELAVANLTIGADNTVKLGAGSKITTTKITGAGTIEIDVTGMTAGEVAAITGDLSGFTGEVAVTGNADVKAEIVDGKIVLKEKIYVAQIGNAKFETLADAIAAVEEGGTVTLLSDVTIDKNTRVNSSGTWYEGVYYQGDKSFTIDLNGKTLTQDGSVNDYLMLFKNEGAKANTITLKNGTIDAGTSAYCAVCTSTTSTQKITINVENINIVGNNSGGAVLKIRGGAELNVKAGTVITGKNSYVGIEAYGAGTVVNVNDGAKIYQQGTGSYVGSLVGASGNATVNVYGGSGTSAQGGFIAMTSGGTINISGGEWTANGDGTASNNNKGILIAQSENGAKSVVNVTGGTFKGGYNCYGTNAGDAQLVISGGTFSADPSDYCAEGYEIKANADGTYGVVKGLKGEGTEANPYLISSVDDLLTFQKKVDEQAQDGSTQFAGKYFKLTADLDLAGINWNPIGTMSGDHGSFKGIFDGDGHTIYNLNVQQAGNGLGLFARTAGNAEIKNLNLHNVTVKSTDNSNYVGGLVGNSYASTKITNVHVTGNIDISGRGYIGGISGHGYVVMDNVSVVGTGTISSTFWCAGGILGYAGEGATNIMNAHVEGITITSAAGGLGAIVGMAEDNNGTQPISGSNLSAKNVEIKTYTGAYGDSYANYALGYLYGGNPTSKLTGNLSVENVKVETSSGEAPKVNDAVATNDGKVYFDLQSAVNAGGEVVVLRDIVLTDTVTVPAGKTVTLNLNGNTISQTKACTESYEMIANNGTLTITGNGKISFKDTGAGDPNAGWGSYTIRNSGTLVVENGTIEHLGEQNKAGQAFAHTTLAIFQYSGSTTINGGTISTPNYRSIRLWSGDVTINGGTFDGQVWVQCVNDSAKLTITGGSFAPNWNDGSSVFVNNSGKKAELAVTGGTFETKIGANDAEALAGAITGGIFSKDAMTGTNATLLHKNSKFGEADENGYYSLVEKKKVAMIGDAVYESLTEAIEKAESGATIELLADVEASAVILIGKSLTINGNGHKVTSNATRVFRLTTSNIVVKLDKVNMVSSAVVTYPNDIRGISIDANLSNVQLTLNASSVDFTDASACDWAYAVNVSGNGTGHTVTVNGGTYEGANVINVHGASNTVIVKGATLNCLYPNNDMYAGACIWVLQNQNSSVEATGNTFTGNNAVAFNLGTGTALTESGNTDNTKLVIAKIGSEYYTTLAEAFAAAQDGDTIKVLQSTKLAESVTNTKKITLDLNGKTITGTDKKTSGNFYLIDNRSELTVTGNGTITLTAETDRDWNASSVVIANNPGGKLVVENGTIEHLGGTDMAYGIDNLTNGKGTYAETIINGGTVKSTYRAVRQFLNGIEAQNILTINGGTIEGANKSVWMQDPSKNANTGTLTIGENAALKGDVYLTVTAGSTAWPVKVSVAAAALKDGAQVLTTNVPAGYELAEIDGVYGVMNGEAKIGKTYYATLTEALKAATSGCEITLMQDITITDKWDARYTGGKITVPVTIDGNGKTITFTGEINDGFNYLAAFRFEANATVKNLTIDMSEAVSVFQNRFSAISAKADLTVDNCKFIGSTTYTKARAIIFGEGQSIGAQKVSVTNSQFINWAYGVVDNMNGQDTASEVTVTGNIFENAGVNVSATQKVTFNDNTVEGAYVKITSYSAVNALSVEAKDNTLTANSATDGNSISAKTIDAQPEFAASYAVASKAELKAALEKAKDGDTILLTADIDYGTDQLAITKAITLNLGGKTLTTRNAYGGMSVKGNPTVKNGTIVHASNTAAIKVWNATAFEDLVIDVQGKGDANKTIGGIVLQSGSTTRVGSIKNVTIKGAALTNGIETYNCGDATENVIGSMENVNIDAIGTGMLISAPCGTATNCTVKGGVNAIEIFIKGNYSASLGLVNSKVEGSVSAHDEFNSNPDIVNNGTLKLTVDEATTGVTTETVSLTINHAAEEQVKGEVLETIIDNAEAKVNGTYYATLAEAMKAAQAGDTVTIMAGEYKQSLNVNKAITVVGETDDNGNNLVKLNGGISITADNAAVKNLTASNPATTGYNCTLTINAKNVLVEGCEITDAHAMRYSETSGNVTLKDCVLTATDAWAIHFNGKAGGNVTIDGCEVTGWVAFAATLDKVTLQDSTFYMGNYAGGRTYNDDVVIDGCTFETGYKFDLPDSGAKVVVTDSKMSDGSSIVNVFNSADACGKNEIVIDGDPVHYVAKIGTKHYESLKEALADVKDYANIKLVDNATLDYNAREAYGRATTTDIIIDGQGFTLTLNQKDSDWSSIGMANADGKLTLKNMTIEKTGYGDTTGAWNTHAINFTTPVEMNNVKVNNAIAVGDDASLNNVTINEANGYYGLWIEANGQEVTVNGGSITATNGGRGIKIADEYVDAPASVILSVDGTKFTTAKKAAVLVSSVAGADITASNVDITNVEADKINFAWVDEDWAADYNKVTVNDAPAAQENVDAMTAAFLDAEGKVISYFKTLQEAVDAAEAGQTVTVIKNSALTETVTVPAGKTITLDLNGFTVSMETNDNAVTSLILNNGDLTITDSSDAKSGKLSYNYTGTNGSDAYNTIETAPGSKLTVKGGTIENLSANCLIAYAIDGLTNGNIGDVTVNIEGGVITSERQSIRIFANSTTKTGTLNITGGEIIGRVIVQNANASANKAALNITGGTFNTNAYKPTEVLYVGGSNGATIDMKPVVSGGTFYGEVISNMPAGFITGGTYKVAPADELLAPGYEVKYDSASRMFDIVTSMVASVNGKPYATLTEAVNAVQNGGTIFLMKDVVLTEDVTVPEGAKFTLDMMTYTLNGSILAKNAEITIQNGSIVNTNGSVSAIEINAGTLTLTNVNIDSARHAVRIDGKVTATIDGGEYKLIPAAGRTHHAVNVSGEADVTIKSGTFVGPKGTVSDSGAAVNVQQNATVTIEGGSFSGGKRNTLASAGTLTVTGGTFDQDPTAFVHKDYKAVKNDAGKYEIVKKVYVVMIGEAGYESFAEALIAAKDGDTIELIWTEGDAPIAMNGYVSGKTVTITGTAQVDWEKGFLFVGRTNDGTAAADATLIFQNAELTTTQGGDHGIHVSGAEKGKADKANGTVNFVNSTVNLSYLINKGEMSLDNSTLTVKSGFSIGGRPAKETVSGQDATATLNLTNGSKVVVNNHNGMGLGYEAIGVMNIDATSSFETTQSFLVTAKGTMNLAGTATIAGTLTNNGSIVLKDVAATMTSSECGNVTTDVADYKVVYESGAYKLAPKDYVAQIDEVKYETLAEAISKASAGDTIKLIADVTENVTINKNLTIDGAEKNYTGTMTANAGLNVTVQNVNFVNGGVVKNTTSSTGNYTFKNCNFDGEGKYYYPLSFRGASKITVENCTVENYVYSFLYIRSGTNTVSVKNVTVENCPSYAVYFSSGVNNATFENLTVKNSNNGFVINNTANRAFTIKNCKMENVTNAIAEANGTNTITCTVLGDQNDFGTAVSSQYAKYVLAETTATLTAPEGKTVTTDVADYKVVYEDGAYKLVAKKYVAQIGGEKFESLQAAINAAVAGDNTIKLLVDSAENVTVKQTEGVNIVIDGNGKTYSGTMLVDGMGRSAGTEKLTIQNVNFVTDKAGHYFIEANAAYHGQNYNYAHNVTVKNSSFAATGAAVDSAAAMRIRQGFDIAIEDVETKNLHSLLQAYGNDGITINDVIVNGKNGISVGTSTGVVITKADITATGYGIRADGTAASDMTVKNSTITANDPIVVRKTTGAYELTVEGNTLTANNEKKYAVVFTNGDDGTYETPTGAYTLETDVDPMRVFPQGLKGSGTETDPYQIGTVEELILFRDSVNAGETRYNAEGVYVALTADIDLTNIDWSVNIGDDCNATFDGIFDGKDHTISNLTSTETAAKADGYICTGLFGAIAGKAVVKNLTIDGAVINTGDFVGNNVSAVVGFAYNATGSIENVKVTNSTINAKDVTGTGAIVGYVYGGDLDVTDCSVEDTNITGAAYVGGIVGYADDKMVISDCTVTGSKIDATSCAAGGIAGILLAGGKIENVTVTNVSLTSAHENWKNAAAAAVGSITGTVTVDGTFDTITVNGEASAAVVGSAHANKPTTPVAKVQAKIGNTYYVTFANAFKAVKANETITLLDNVTLSETLVVEQSIGLDVNGNTFTGTIELTAGTELTAAAGLNVITNVVDSKIAYANGVYSIVAKDYVVEIKDGVKYESLAAAIKAAKAGNTIVFLADITENVTIDKNLTIDGAEFKYTGTMTANAGLTVTVENVNFVNGGFDKSTKSTTGNYTIKNCTFVDDGKYAYAFRFKGANSITIENCTVKDYLYSFLYVTSSTNKVSVKNVTVEDCPNYAVYFSSGVNSATFENLTVKNSDRGFLINNTANRAFTIKNCKMEKVTSAIAEANGTNTITCTVLGNENDFGTAASSQYAKYVLAETTATLTAPEGATVTTNVEGYEIEYVDGVYKVVKFVRVAKINETGIEYKTLQAAIDAAEDGQTITLIADLDLTTAETVTNSDGYATMFNVAGESVTIDLNGKAIKVTASAADLADDKSTMLMGVFAVDTDGYLTLKDSSEAKTGSVAVTANDATIYSLAIAYDGLLNIESGSYSVDKMADGRGMIYGQVSDHANEDGSNKDKGVNISGGTFTLGNVGDLANGSPWILSTAGSNTGKYIWVTGGTFNDDILHQHWIFEVEAPDNKALKNNGDGTWTMVDAVAMVEEYQYDTYYQVIGYATLAEAIENAEEGETVTILADCELTETWNCAQKVIVNEGVSFTIADGASIVLKTEAATVKAAEGLNIVTDIENHKVVYENGTYKVVAKNYTVQIEGGEKYETLAEAIAKAQADDTIVFLTDITENVTINKNVTIDGADKNYTGTMTISKSINLTVENVKFVEGNIVKGNSTGTTGTYTIKNCDFSSEKNDVYAVELRGTSSIVIENCTSTGYYGFLQVPSTNNSVSLKDVTIAGAGYAVKVDYSNGVTLENVKITDSTYGFVNSNFGAKTITVKGCTIAADYPLVIWDRDTKLVNTFKFEGENDFGSNAFFYNKVTEAEMAYTKYVLVDTNATLKAVEGLDVTTDVADYKVVYENGVYKLVAMNYVAQIGEKKFESLVEAFEAAEDGDTITMIADHVMDGSKAVNDTTWIYDNLIVSGEAITLDFAGYTVEVTPNFTATDDGGLKNTLESIIFIEKGGSLTLKDETGKGGFHVKAGTNLYSMIYNSGSTLVIESGNYHVEETTSNGSLIYADGAHSTTVNGGVFTLDNAGADGNTTKPWMFNVEGKNESFVTVNGGYFNDNPYKNHGTAKDCEVTIPDGKLFKQLTEGKYIGYWVLVDAVAQNTNTDAIYATLEDALNDAQSGETVIPLVDLTEEAYATIVPAGVTLNLNGKYVIAKNLLAFGNVIDSKVDDKTEGKGGIKISNNKANAYTQLQATNTYMPLYDAGAGCYRFFSYKLGIMTYGTITDNSIKFRFRLRLGSVEAFKLLADTANSGVKLTLNLNWTGLNTDFVYVLEHDAVVKYANEAYNQVISGEKTLDKMSKYLAVTVTGLEMLESGAVMTAMPNVTSETGVSRTVTNLYTDSNQYTIP